MLSDRLLATKFESLQTKLVISPRTNQGCHRFEFCSPNEKKRKEKKKKDKLGKTVSSLTPTWPSKEDMAPPIPIHSELINEPKTDRSVQNNTQL